MKILWLQDLDPMVETGGAQLTDRSMIVEGIRRGHDIHIAIPTTCVTFDYDCFVISNTVSFPVELFQSLVSVNKRCIWFNHDYSPICKYRLFYPMLERCKSCYLRERWLPILRQAEMMTWLSPLHRDSWLWLYPELSEIKSVLCPSPVDTDYFKDLGMRRNGVVCPEGLYEFKGMKHHLQWAIDNPDKEITFVGGSEGEVNLPPNCKVVGYVSQEQMLEFYNKAEYLLHLPQSPSPFDRVCVEAYLSGCRIIGNVNTGALSWPFFVEGKEAVTKACKESPKRFWESVEGVIK